MKSIVTILAAPVLLALTAPFALAEGDLLAIRVGKAETISQGTIEHAVILVEGGKIVTVAGSCQ